MTIATNQLGEQPATNNTPFGVVPPKNKAPSWEADLEKELNSPTYDPLPEDLKPEEALLEVLNSSLKSHKSGDIEERMKWHTEVMRRVHSREDVGTVQVPFSLARGVMPLSGFQTQELPPLVPLLTNFLNEKEHMAIYAPAGAGKSMFALMISILAAAPPRNIGMISNGGGGHKVMYIDGENSPQDAQNRFINVCGMLDVEPSSLNNFLYYNSEMENAELHFKQFEDHRKQLLNYISQEKIKLVVIDNFRTLFGSDENSADVLDEFNRFLDKIKAAGAGAVVLHHTNKATDKANWPVYSGSTNFARPYWVMMPLRVKKGEGYTKENRKLVLEFQMDKDRSGTTGMAIKQDIGTITLCEKEGILVQINGAEPLQFDMEEALVVNSLRNHLTGFLEEGYEIPEEANKRSIWEVACGPYHNKRGYKDQASKVLPKLLKELQEKQRMIEKASPQFQRV